MTKYIRIHTYVYMYIDIYTYTYRQRVGHDWATELNWTDIYICCIAETNTLCISYNYFLIEKIVYFITYILNNLKKYLFLAALGLPCWADAFSNCGAQASHCSGISCGAQAVEYLGFRSCGYASRAQAEQLLPMGLVAQGNAASSQTRDPTNVPCTVWRIL